MQELISIILATGEGTRMNSSVAKAAHKICGKPILSYVTEAAKQAGSESMILVLGQRADQIKELAPEGAALIIQDEKSGVGYTALQTQELLKGKTGTILLLYGDTPAITGETLKNAYEYHCRQENQVTILTAQIDDKGGYGKTVSDSQNRVSAIIDEKDAFDEQKPIKKINSGIYFFNIDTFLESLNRLNRSINQDNQEEYFPGEIIKEIIIKSKKVGSYKVRDSSEVMSVDSMEQLDAAEHAILKRIINRHMKNGVIFHLPETCMIDTDVLIGKNTVIQPGTSLEGHTVIGENCVIGPNSRIEDGIIGDGVYFMNSVMTQSQVGNNTKVGPFAYIRPGSKIGQNIKIGDFVEIKNSSIDDGTKVPHLSYVGDADIGKGVNIGCGAVVVNYDGKKKHRTVVGDHAFVGCNVNLVSPVVVKDYSYIAAGSTITEEVPEYALAIARSRQTIIENWVKKKGLDKK
jgi:bifunctional UDP-N-acetylglucosamine pyrophosphorylase/glucosamine-1-phosphate N-acetyltransferase